MLWLIVYLNYLLKLTGALFAVFIDAGPFGINTLTISQSHFGRAKVLRFHTKLNSRKLANGRCVILVHKARP